MPKTPKLTNMDCETKFLYHKLGNAYLFRAIENSIPHNGK